MRRGSCIHKEGNDADHDSSTTGTLNKERIKSFQKRIKALLKEPGNQRCSECYSKKHKPKWMSLIQAPIDADRGTLGVFCCNTCHVYHEKLGPELCAVKSLKAPEECK